MTSCSRIRKEQGSKWLHKTEDQSGRCIMRLMDERVIPQPEMASRDYGNLLAQYDIGVPPDGEDAIRSLVEAMRTVSAKPKEATYYDAVAEQQRLGIEYVGFEKDPDFADLPTRLESIFGKYLLDECLISKITYYPDTVLVAIDGQHYAVPVDEYAGLVASSPGVATHRVRAYGAANINLHPASKRYMRTPIGIYSFTGEPLENKDYLPGVNEATKSRVYKQGTVVHEVAHHIWNNILTSEQREEWKRLSQQSPSLTQYAESYEGRQAWDEEQFGEAIRVYTTNYSYLLEHSEAAAGFINETLPRLGSIV
jgi:hypothetical protein